MSDARRRVPALRRHRRLAVVVIALTLTVATVLLSLVWSPPAPANAPTAYSLWDTATVPQQPAAEDTASVEVGLQFRVSAGGALTGMRFYKSAENTGPHVGTIWSSDGVRLASARFSTTDTGWQTVRFAQAVAVRPGDVFTASYRAPRGRYAADAHFFDDGRQVTQANLTALAGVYTYDDDQMPAQEWQSNYYVDVLYEPDSAAGTEAPVGGTDPPADEQAGEPGVHLRQVDGGTGYYRQFTSSLPDDPSYFPIGIWFESVLSPADVAADKAAGINLYVELTANSDLSLLDGQGMHALPSRHLKDPAVAGYLTSDEADMWAGAGSAAWVRDSMDPAKICKPATAKCGYTVMKTLADEVPRGALTYANYGKGVTFWLDDDEAAQFVNDYQDVLSVDTYWFTDPRICGASEGGALLQDGQRALTAEECRRAANYGATVERVRQLVRPAGAKPVWNFAELGHPFTEDAAPTITGEEIAAATWSSIIHGARGIVYFNHSFGGACSSQHVLRDACGSAVRPEVMALNRRITRLAPVLNAPFVDGLVRTTGRVDVAAKLYRGDFYLIAGSTQAAAQRATLSFACGGATRAEVVGEKRSITLTDGQLTDQFDDGTSVHIYRLHGGNTCGLK